MALINQNSVIGVTSITSPSASNVLTVHTNDTTERLRVSTSGLSFSGTNASLDTSGNISAVDGTFTGNVSIGGTLTYEDVTNIDSVGIITAQAGIRVTGGSVGIGTDNPAFELSIHGTGAVRNQIVCTDNNAAGAGINLKTMNGGSTVSNATLHTNTTGDLLIWTGTSGASERLRITSDGDVGIGEDAPVSKLHLANSGSGNVSMTITNDTTGHTTGNGVEIGMGGDEQAQIWNYENTYFRIATNSTERLRIAADGNVGIGLTNPSNEFHVKGSGTVAYFEGTGGNSFIGLEDSDDSTVGFIGVDGGSLKFQTSGSSYSDKFVITSGGDIGISKTVPVQWGSGIPTIEIKGTVATGGLSTRSGAIAFESGSGSDGYATLWGQEGGIHIYTSATDRANTSYSSKFHSDGNLHFAAGKGISFSSNANAAGMTSEVLDDYEEGTWTVTLNTSGGSLAYTVNNTTGYYTKVGNLVNAWWYSSVLNITNNGIGYARVLGLPFISSAASQNYGVVGTAHNTAFTPAADGGYVAGNNSEMIFQPTGSTTSSNWTQANTRYLMIHAVYQSA